jgi:hypothetical protein
MPEYRLYRQRPNGEIITPAEEEFFASSDLAAARHAARQPWPEGCEVWCGDRFIAAARPQEGRGPAAERRRPWLARLHDQAP